MNIVYDVLRKLESNPNKVVFEYIGLKVTARQFKDCIQNFELHMRNRGINRNSCVALFAEDISVSTALTLAIALIGCKWVKLSSSSLENNKITHVIYYHDKKILEDNPNVFRMDDSWKVKPEVIPEITNVEFNSGDVWMIAESSGTTGKPKFIEISYKSFYHRVTDDAKNFTSKRQKVWFVYPSLKSSVQYKALTAMLNNVTIITKISYNHLQSNPNTLIVGSLGQINKLIEKQPVPRKPFNTTVDITGAATSRADAERFLKYFKEIRLCYGSTEASRSHQKTITNIEQYNGSVGKPLHGSVAEIGENGLIRIFTPRTASGYVNGEKFINGWFTPGDLGYVVGSELFITGRADDNINVGGVKLDPVQIETIINSVRGVERSMVFAGDKGISAIIVGIVDVKKVLDKCLDNVGPSKTPVCYYFSDGLPLNENGKYSRKEANQFVSELQPAFLA